MLLAEPFFGDIGDVVIQTHWEKRVADDEERIHAISSFVDLMSELEDVVDKSSTERPGHTDSFSCDTDASA